MSLKPSVTRLYRFMKKNPDIKIDKAKFLSLRKDWTETPTFQNATEDEINLVDENLYLYFEYKKEYAVRILEPTHYLEELKYALRQ